MPEPELERLEGILSREAVYFKYHEKIAGAESLEALKELEYEIMEDESLYFSAVSERVWNDFTRKEEMLSGKTQETSGHDVQKRDYRVGDGRQRLPIRIQKSLGNTTLMSGITLTQTRSLI